MTVPHDLNLGTNTTQSPYFAGLIAMPLCFAAACPAFGSVSEFDRPPNLSDMSFSFPLCSVVDTLGVKFEDPACDLEPASVGSFFPLTPFGYLATKLRDAANWCESRA